MDSLHGKTFLRASLLVVALLFAFPAFAQISVGITIAPPPAPRVVTFRPATPGQDYLWVEGYWAPVGNHYKWHDGYWSRPPYLGANWVAPCHDGKRFFAGYWDGSHGRVDHEHPWTPDRERAFHAHEHDRDLHEQEVHARHDDHDRDRGDHHDHQGDHDR